MQCMRSMKRNAGFTLTEFLITAAIVGGILAIVVPIGISALEGQNATNETRRVESISEAIYKVYQRANNFNGLNQNVARDLGVFPEGMDDGAAVFNVWNENVAVASAADLAGNANRAFTITEQNVPVDACGDFASNNAGADRVQVNGTTVYEVNATPLDVATISNQCAGGPADVTFLFEKR